MAWESSIPDLHMSRGTAGASHSFSDIRAVLLSKADLPEPAAPYRTNGLLDGPVM